MLFGIAAELITIIWFAAIGVLAYLLLPIGSYTLDGWCDRNYRNMAIGLALIVAIGFGIQYIWCQHSGHISKADQDDIMLFAIMHECQIDPKCYNNLCPKDQNCPPCAVNQECAGVLNKYGKECLHDFPDTNSAKRVDFGAHARLMDCLDQKSGTTFFQKAADDAREMQSGGIVAPPEK